MDLPRDVVRSLRDQDGVIGRRQALSFGLSQSDIDRLRRRKEWNRLLPGVYVDHTGAPTWMQRAWAGVLYYEPSALAGNSALRATAGPGWRQHDDAGPIWVAVPAIRNVSPRAGYRIRYLADFDDQVLTHTHPPRMRFEEAVWDLVGGTRSPLDRIQHLADACRSRRTTVERMRRALARRSRMTDRRWLEAVLRDIADGTHSVLEHGYLTKVERPHGLPAALRQHAEATPTGKLYRDAAYVQFGELVELDGRIGHDSPLERDDDLERDLDAAVSGRGTIRLGWGQVFDRACQTAGKIGIVLRNRGWTAPLRPCGPSCQAPQA